MNPYASYDRAQAEREQEAEAFAAWCEANDIEDPTPADEARYEEEMRDAEEAWAEQRAEEAAEARMFGDW